MSLPEDEAWFPAKRYGYGWGFPIRWQGWVVFVLYFGVVIAAGVAFARTRPGVFLGCMAVSTALLVAVCSRKGVAPKWRWGGTADGDDKT